MKQKLWIGWVVLGLVGSLACQLVERATPTAVMTPSLPPATSSPVSTATSLPPITPATPTPRPTLPPASPTPVRETCPTRQTPPLPDRPDTFAAYPERLLAYLQAGADPLTLLDVLQGWAAVPPLGQALLQGDLTGDGQPEVVLVAADPLAEVYPPRSVMLIFACRAGTVQLLYQATAEEWASLAAFAVEDLTQDGRADLLWAEATCGAHTCFYATHVGSWDGQTLVERLGGPLEVAYPTYEVREGQLYVTSAGIASVGAGPQRLPTLVWSWDGRVITQTESLWPPIQYRYHQFLAGERALAAGDLTQAQVAYETTITDAQLLAWAAYTDAPTETAWLTALARWRLMEVQLLRGEPDMAGFHYQQLQKTTPPDSPAYPVLRLVQAFWQAWQQGGDLPQACAAAQARPESQTVLDFLNGFGYANPFYELEDLCPVLRE